MDVVSPQAVSIERKAAGKDTVATLVLAPANDIWIGWKPRSRDVAREKAVFYAELTQLYAPTAGVIEGLHHAAIRPAQGELAELLFDVPKGATITDVLDPATLAPPQENTPPRFDRLAMAFRSRHRKAARESHSAAIAPVRRCSSARRSPPGRCRSTQSVGLISVENAAGQIGLLGVATGNEVQLDTVTAETLSPINLEDFPGNVAPVLAAQIPGLTVRRAFRYADVKATAAVKASAVEPDVRVESQDTLSLGEDRVLLAVNATVEITRAGIFRLSFALPAGMDVESIAGKALSHWTELKTDAGRIITMHLRGRTEGQQQFAISLTGPGLKAAKAWTAPQLVFREASKQRGTFLVVPEQGMRLQVTTREGVTQLDPQKAGIKQKGVLAFRVLQTPWNLALDVEQVDPWVQVTSLQHATVGEAQMKITANLQYQIENTGLKTFRVSLPTNAENVRFQGDQVADFLKLPNVNAEMVHVGSEAAPASDRAYLLQVTYQVPLPANAAETRLLPGIAGHGREFATRFRHRAIGRPPASARRDAASSPPADGMAEHSARAAKGFVRLFRELRLPAGRSSFPALDEARTSRSREAPACAREQHHVHFGDLRQRRDAHPGAPRNHARRQTPAASHVAEGCEVLVRLRESKRRLAVARRRPDSHSARATIARRSGDPRQHLLQQPDRRSRNQCPRSCNFTRRNSICRSKTSRGTSI